MNKRHTNLRLAAANLGPGNWRERINRLACQTAHDTLANAGPAQCTELAFALLQNYYLLAYASALPFLEHDGSLGTRLDTLRKTIQSAGMEIDTTIICKEHRHD